MCGLHPARENVVEAGSCPFPCRQAAETQSKRFPKPPGAQRTRRRRGLQTGLPLRDTQWPGENRQKARSGSSEFRERSQAVDARPLTDGCGLSACLPALMTNTCYTDAGYHASAPGRHHTRGEEPVAKGSVVIYTERPEAETPESEAKEQLPGSGGGGDRGTGARLLSGSRVSFGVTSCFGAR